MRNKNEKAERAVSKINQMIRDGKLTRGKCSECSKKNAEAHHPDYNYPLEIIWLCRKHHEQLHHKYYPLVGVRVNEDMYKIISEMAKKEKVPKTEICRALIDLALKEIIK